MDNEEKESRRTSCSFWEKKCERAEKNNGRKSSQRRGGESIPIAGEWNQEAETASAPDLRHIPMRSSACDELLTVSSDAVRAKLFGFFFVRIRQVIVIWAE